MCAGHRYIMQLICSYASPTPETYSALSEWFYVTCTVKSDKAELLCPSPCSPQEACKAALCKCRISLFCTYNTDVWFYRNSSENSSENPVVELKTLTAHNHRIPKDRTELFCLGIVCIHRNFELKCLCSQNDFFISIWENIM